MILCTLPLFVIAQEDTLTANAISYRGSIENGLSAEENYERALKAFEGSFGTYSGTKLNYHSSTTDSLHASSRVNFEQYAIQNRNATRGPIRFNIGIKAEEKMVSYHLYQFIHTGNTDERMGPKSFGELTDRVTSPKIPGITRVSRNIIWQEIKDTVDVNIKKRILEFEEQLGRTF